MSFMAAGAAYACAAPACAGAWPQPPGAGQIILQTTLTRANESFDAAGALRPASPYEKLEISPYAEYGWSRSLTLIAEAAWTRDHTKYYIWDFTSSGFTRAKAGARLSLGMWQDTRFSLQARGIIHFATRADDPYISKRGDVDARIDLVLGRSFTLLGVAGFSDSQFGYTWKPRGLPGEISIDITIGLKPWDGTMVLVKTENFGSLQGSSSALMHSVSTSKLGLSLVQDITASIACELGYMQTLTGRNIIKERSLRLGLWYKF